MNQEPMNLQTRLSAHFTLGELTRSRSHPEVKNIPSPVQVENLKRVCVWLEALRARYNERYGDGEEPIIITSGYRCKELNELITHHSNTSQHMAGQAVDFYVGDGLISDFKFQVSSESRRELLIKAFRLILTLESITFDQVIIYPSFIHVSFVSNGRNRRKITKGYGNGKYCALNREEALSIN